jgi:hypothetical protein
MFETETNVTKNRDGEKGAALIMALLISFLLLVASAGLILETTANTMNVTDATAEQQAFNAAESGIQAAVYALRDNITLPDAMRIDATKPATDKVNRINYSKALDPETSNVTESGLDVAPRLSRWMQYDSNYPDRIGMGNGTYVARNGYAYSLEVSDPDHTGALVSYQSVSKLSENDGAPNRMTYGNTTNGFVIEMLPRGAGQVDTTGGSISTDFGTVRVTKYGNGVPITLYNRFAIDITMTVPYWGVRVIRGWIVPNTCPLGVCTMPAVRFDSRTFTLQGSQIVLETVGGNAVSTTYAPEPRVDGHPSGFAASLIAAAAGATTDSTIVGSLSSPEPIRLLIKSTGYGPRGATKRLEAVIQKNFFNGLTAPATLTLIGPSSTTACASPTCVPARPATNFTFALGNSNAMLYSGQDAESTDIIPPIGTLGQTNLDSVFDNIDDVNRWNRVVGVPSDITSDTPAWLSTPAQLDVAVKSLANVASASGRYFANGVQPTTFGNPNGTGITFCDGNCDFTGDGGGIMVVTGKLTLRGRFAFRGIIIVTGQGGVDRQGAGNGTIEGNMVIAPYVNSSVLPSSEPVGSAFLAPQYDLAGGGASTIQYNSTAINDGLVAVSNFVLGVVEK